MKEKLKNGVLGAEVEVEKMRDSQDCSMSTCCVSWRRRLKSARKIITLLRKDLEGF